MVTEPKGIIVDLTNEKETIITKVDGTPLKNVHEIMTFISGGKYEKKFVEDYYTRNLNEFGQQRIFRDVNEWYGYNIGNPTPGYFYIPTNIQPKSIISVYNEQEAISKGHGWIVESIVFILLPTATFVFTLGDIKEELDFKMGDILDKEQKEIPMIALW